jgi:preprotein translocase subunit SecF
MEIIKSDTHFNFVSLMKPAIFVSVAFILIGIASIVWHSGLNYGIDFAGGTLVQIKFHKETPTNRIRDALKMINLGSSIIQPFGLNEVIVRIAQSSTNDQDPSVRIKDALGAALGQGSFEIRRVEVVGPKVSKDLTRKAILAVIFSWIGILVYVGIRFEFRYALGGVMALLHDVLVTVSAMALLNKEFDLNIVAALLTIIGYSINDTIVIFDRIRENSRKNMKMALSDVVNLSVNQTLSRTLLTSLTVFMVLLILFFFGGAVIHDFTFAMLVGTVAGVYSTVFIASPLILAFERIKPSKIRLKRGK